MTSILSLFTDISADTASLILVALAAFVILSITAVVVNKVRS